MPHHHPGSLSRIRPAALIVLTLLWIAASPLLERSQALTNGGSLTALDTPVTEDFDSLAQAGTSVTWSDDSTIPGWYSTRPTYNTGTGGSNTGALYSFGVAGAGALGDRALGSVASGTTTTIYQAARLTNNTGTSITSLDISYTGEQWRNGGNTAAHTLTFQYQIANPGVVTGANSPSTGWTTFSSLNFTGPVATPTAAALDGNAPGNRVALSANLPVTLGAGQEIWLRWVDPDDGGADHGLAVDDFSVTPRGLAGDSAPTVVQSTPAANATGVSVDSTIVINFSEAVIATASAFNVECPVATSVAFSQTASPSGSFTLTPASPLPPSTLCTVTVTGNQITDVDTNDPPDQMSGTFAFSFTTATATPPATTIIINEVDADTPGTDVAEFVELYDGGVGSTSLNGLVLVFYNGSNDLSYAAFDLDGFMTNAQGYFTLGNAGVPGVTQVFNSNLLQNGADAVALFVGSASDFPAGTAVTTGNLIDAIVYGTDDPDDSGLLTLLNVNEPQVNEAGGGSGDIQSSQRCPNGAGGARNTSSYLTASPTPNIANVCPPPPQPSNSPVVISQLYGGGGNPGATYQNDFVELFNRSASPVDLTGWSLQYAAATGSGWAFTLQPLGGPIGPGEYLLVSLASGGPDGLPLPAPNISGLINMSATQGKLALVNSFDGLSGNCPIGDPHIMDLVGYGGADCREGATTAPSPNNTTAIFRLGGGATDTDRNGSDFVTGAPAPRRTAPIVELGPLVLSSDPRVNGVNAPRDPTMQITFTEPVDVVGAWYDITCASTGQHNNATVAGGGQQFFITPNVDLQAGEQCTVTIYKGQIFDTDTDDSGVDTDTLPADYVWSFTVAAGTAPPYPPAEHLAMGNPTGAVADVNQPLNYLMMKPEYALSYNRDLGRPNWVSWHLSDEWIGTLTRVDTFRADPQVPPDWYRVQSFDFTNSGFDRGHMVPNADRDKETSIPINQATFLMSNMVAQAPDNNQGPWAAFENYLRTLLPADELYIVAGGAGTGGMGSNGGLTATVADGHVTVPAFTWKVVLVLPKGEGDVQRASCSSRTIAVIMPNVQGIRNDPWENYLTSVDAVETLTGYDLFSNLPLAIQACVEAGINGNNPPLDATPPAISCGQPDGLWHAANVSITCTAVDAESGLASPAADASFVLSTSVVAGVETSNAMTNQRVICDVAGNCAQAGPIGGNMIDRKAPAISIASPAAVTYLLGQSVAASYTCNDDGSGVNTCAGPVASGQAISTSAPGPVTFTVTATDAVGNAASQSVSYSVGYNVCALYDQTKAHKIGSTVPIRLQICDYQGGNLSASSRIVTATAVVLIATSAPGPLEDTGNANPDNQFRFVPDATGGAYAFNLSTKSLAQGTYALVFTISGDPVSHSVQFQVR